MLHTSPATVPRVARMGGAALLAPKVPMYPLVPALYRSWLGTFTSVCNRALIRVPQQQFLCAQAFCITGLGPAFRCPPATLPRTFVLHRSPSHTRGGAAPTAARVLDARFMFLCTCIDVLRVVFCALPHVFFAHSGPTTVLVCSLMFIGFVVVLHIYGKFRK